jgi:hypothetical protein
MLTGELVMTSKYSISWNNKRRYKIHKFPANLPDLAQPNLGKLRELSSPKISIYMSKAGEIDKNHRAAQSSKYLLLVRTNSQPGRASSDDASPKSCKYKHISFSKHTGRNRALKKTFKQILQHIDWWVHHKQWECFLLGQALLNPSSP